MPLLTWLVEMAAEPTDDMKVPVLLDVFGELVSIRLVELGDVIGEVNPGLTLGVFDEPVVTLMPGDCDEDRPPMVVV